MRKALLLILFITALPILASAESLHILFPVTTSFSSDNSSVGASSDGISLRYIGNSGIGIGFTSVNQNALLGADGSYNNITERKLSYKALEFSYTLGFITLGLGSLISGSMRKDVGKESKEYKYKYKVSGSTAFSELALKIYGKGSLLLGYHLSQLKFTGSSDSESGTLNNVMLGFRIPI